MTGALRAAVADLVDAVRQLEGLTGQVGPFALHPDTCDRAPEAVIAVCQALNVPLTFDAPSGDRDRDFAAVALAAQIRRAQRSPVLAGLNSEEGGAVAAEGGARPGRARRPPVLAGLNSEEVAAVAAEARRRYEDENAEYRTHSVRRPDGTAITAVEAGPPPARCVLISPPCALSYRLSLPWLRALRSSYRCVVMQTRGTSERIENPEDFDRRGHDVSHQADDLLALAEELPAGPVHVMGLCDGAAVALTAAARQPDRVSSLSLWHAALELGGEVKTDHQINLRALLGLGGESRDTAAWLRAKLTSGPMS